LGEVDSYYSTGLAYEIMPGNTSDKTTLKLFLEKIQAQYGQAKRIWIMDRGIPTEETLKEMRQSDPARFLSGRHPARPLGAIQR
jgi:transposase